MRRQRQIYTHDQYRKNVLPERGSVRAILGPTNTGKTHFAIDRMLAHASGMIGFPLRLLARENYDRIKKQMGVGAVALVTGEEKLIPTNPRWFICTVESMPLDRLVEFLAVDEIQLCTDKDRGHIFTDRLLHARGLSETVFLGSDIMAPALRTLVPNIRIDERIRMSTLTYAGATNLTRLPRRSAIVGFSVNQVYQLAERVRQQRGGAAVVLGALSPRTRNAQVAMYEAGEVDYMVATDAIGMGLNMDVDHIAFSGLRKFDGQQMRLLSSMEMGQIAGRAGRHMSNGTFGTTAGLGPLSPELIEAIESHRFEQANKLYWRSRNLDYRSPKHLLKSLSRSPVPSLLSLVMKGEVHLALLALARNKTVKQRATRPETVRMLWDVCQIPDFRKVLPDHHISFLGQVFMYLSKGDGQLPEDWVGRQLDQLENMSGDIDMLTGRLADVRTWTYISHRGSWLRDSLYWRGRSGAIEEKLSEALPERLMRRFVDRRVASIDRKKESGSKILSAVTSKGDVIVEGLTVGRMEGVEFVPFFQTAPNRREILVAARRAAAESIMTRVNKITIASHSEFKLTPQGAVFWDGKAIATLEKGESIISPEIRVIRSDLLDEGMRGNIRAKVFKWLNVEIAVHLKDLIDAQRSGIRGRVGGLVFRLYEHLGALPDTLKKGEWQALSIAERNQLNRLGIRITPSAIFFPKLQRKSTMRLKWIFWSVYTKRTAPSFALGARVNPAGKLTKTDWACLGYRKIGSMAFRFEVVDAMARIASKKAQQGRFIATIEMMRLIEGSEATLTHLMMALGYVVIKVNEQTEFRRKQQKYKGRTDRQHAKPIDPQSPFAVLREQKNKIKSQRIC